MEFYDDAGVQSWVLRACDAGGGDRVDLEDPGDNAEYSDVGLMRVGMYTKLFYFGGTLFVLLLVSWK